MEELEINSKRETRRTAVLPSRGLSPNYQRTVSKGAFPKPARSASPPRLTSPDKLGVGYSTRESRPPTSPGAAGSLQRRSPSPKGLRYEPGEKMHVFKPRARTRAAAFQENLKAAVQGNDLQELLNVYSAALDLDAVGKADTVLVDRFELEKLKKRIKCIFRRRIMDHMTDNGLAKLKQIVEEIDTDCLLSTLANFAEFLQAKAFIELKNACKAVQAIEEAFENGRGAGVIPNRVQKEKYQALKDALSNAKRLQLPSEHIEVARELVQNEKTRTGEGLSAVDLDVEKRKAPLQSKKTFPNMDRAVSAAAKDRDVDQLRDVVKAAQDMGIEGDGLHEAADALFGFEDLEEELRDLQSSANEEDIQMAIEKAEYEGISCSALEGCKDRLQRLQRVREELVRGVREEDLTLLDKAMHEAEEMGMEGEFVVNARHRMKLKGGPEAAKDAQARLVDRLQVAIKSRRASQLREAIVFGKDNGAPMLEIFKAERVLAEEMGFLQAIQADLDKILAESPIEFAKGKETLCPQDRAAVQKIALLLGTLPEAMSFSVHVHHNCSPVHLNGLICSADNSSLSGHRARNLKSALCSASERTNILARGWGCQHPAIGPKKLVRIMPTQLEE